MNLSLSLSLSLYFRAGAGVSLLKYFEYVDDDDAGSTGGVGLLILKAIHILSNGSDKIVSAMMTSNLCSVLVRCINLFLELPHPAGKMVNSPLLPPIQVNVFLSEKTLTYMYIDNALNTCIACSSW